VDRLRQDDIERARRKPLAQRLREALDTMQTGIDLKRAALHRQHPEDSDADIEARLREWLRRE
jgi:hypothetical protein